jgi:transcriptional regulator with XRE-family HTH domain
MVRNSTYNNMNAQDTASPWFQKWAKSASVGERLKWILEVRGMKQTELAEAMAKLSKDEDKTLPAQSRSASTQSSVSNVITNYSRKPSAPTLLRMASVLGANPYWLIFGEGQPFEVVPAGKKHERAMIDAFRELDPTSQAAILAAAKAMKK